MPTGSGKRTVRVYECYIVIKYILELKGDAVIHANLPETVLN